MRSTACVIVLAGCGRLGFDAQTGDGAVGADACATVMADASSSRPSAIGVLGAGAGNEWTRAAAEKPGGGFVVAGQYSSPIMIGGTPLGSVNIDVFLLTVDAAGGLEWARTVRSGGSDETVLGVDVDEEGNIYLAGNGNEGIDCGGGAVASPGSMASAYVCALTPLGAHRWSYGFGGTVSVDVAVGAATSGGFAVFTGEVAGDADFGGGVVPAVGNGQEGFIAVYRASDGMSLRTHRFGTTGSTQIRRVAVRPDGSLYAAGQFDGTIDFESTRTAPGPSGFVVALDASGAVAWSQVLASSANAEVRGLAIDATGVYVSGFLDGPTTLGNLTATPAGPRDGFVAALDLDGTPRWFVTLGGGTGCRRLDDVAVEACGTGIAVAGAFQGDLTFAGSSATSSGDDGLVVGFTRDGDPRWLRAWGGSGNDATTTVAISGGTVLMGGFSDAIGEDICGGLTPFAERDLVIDMFAVP